MIIRKFQETDRDAIKEITAICFEGVAIDHAIELTTNARRLQSPSVPSARRLRPTRCIRRDLPGAAPGTGWVASCNALT